MVGIFINQCFADASTHEERPDFNIVQEAIQALLQRLRKVTPAGGYEEGQVCCGNSCHRRPIATAALTTTIGIISLGCSLSEEKSIRKESR
jgi:hypothetical protein